MVDLNQTIGELETLLPRWPLPWAYGESYSDSGALYGEITSSREYAFEDVCGQYGMSREAAELATKAVNALPSLIARIRDLERIEAGVRGLPVISVDGGHSYLRPGDPGYEEALAGMVLVPGLPAAPADGEK